VPQPIETPCRSSGWSDASGNGQEKDSLAEPLWFPSTRTVGRRAGPRGQFRRIGILPFQGEATRLEDHIKGKPQQGIRALVADGIWKVQRWEELSRKTGKVLKFSVVLPMGRYAWRPIAAQVWAAMGLDQGGWALARRAAFQRHAEASTDPLAKRDSMQSIRAALDDRQRRALMAAELWSVYLPAMQSDPGAVWSDATQAIRCRALELERPGLLEVESPTTRQLRRDLESSY